MSHAIRKEARIREEERKKAALYRERFEADIKAVAARPEGKRLLGWLLNQGGLFADDWCADAATAAYYSGKRAFALTLWNLLRRHLSRAAFVEVILPGEAEDEPERLADGAAQRENDCF